ncbi:unnamed protein product, partial [Ranitomeya imitator]
DLKGGNLNVGGVFGQHGGKFEFGNGGETRTFEIHGRHEFNGGFGKSSGENNSEGKRIKFGGIKFGGKFGHGHGSIGAHGKIDVNIKGGNKGSSEENSSEGNKGIKFGGKFGHGHGSIKQNGKIDINIKGRSEESSEEKSSEEKNEHNEKSSFEDIDLDFGTAPTYNPEFTIEPMIIPQTAQLLFQGPVTPNLPVEPEVPVNTPEPEAPVHPEILVVTPEPEAPVHPEILVATPEPEAPVHPEILVATPEPEAPVQPEIPVATPEPEAPVIPEEPEQPVPVTESPPSSGKSCTFYAKFVLHGQTEELACSTCTCDDGSLTCVKNLNCPGVCSVIGLQMIRTFDGTLYESPGNCDYILVKTSDFTISLDNELCSELGYDNYNPDATCIKSVDIYMPQKATIKLLFDGTIQSAGEKADLPYSILDTITVLRSSSVFLDVATPLFNIQYDWVGNRLYVILDQSYKDHTAGLCGTYNDNRNDDYSLSPIVEGYLWSSNDMTETVSSFFTKSWKTQYQCSEDTKDPEDIGPVCKESMVAITDDSLPQQDCAEYTSKLLKITPSIPLNEVCICPTHLYYDASLDECVKGPCERITQCGDREEPPPGAVKETVFH